MLNILSAILNMIVCKDSRNEKNEAEISQMKLDIQLIKENHLAHIQDDMNNMRTDIKIIKESLTDIKIILSKLN